MRRCRSATQWKLRLAIALCTAAVLPAAQAQEASNACGPIANAYGPFDYRTQKDMLRIVENVHFRPNTEALIRGKTGEVGGDLDYTLRASPNHHRALTSMMRYGEKLKLPKVPKADYPVECYFDRAIRFAPDDLIVRMLYATFLAKGGRTAEAEKQLEYAGVHGAASAITLNNVGLVYVEHVRNPARALEYAHRAIALGMDPVQLKQKLQASGQWRDPEAAAPSLGASGAVPR